MNNLFRLAYKYRTFLLFLILEVISFTFIVSFNPYHNSSYLYSSNQISGSLASTFSSVTGYFQLNRENEALAKHNAFLLEQLASQKVVKTEYSSLKDVHQELLEDVVIDTLPDSTNRPFYHYVFDTLQLEQYVFIPAKTVKNDIRYQENYLTINKGKSQGIVPGMGVINGDGVVGMVVNTSDNYALVKSVLHISHFISAKLEKNGLQASLSWNGKNIAQAELDYVPKHIAVSVGDRVVTSGYNTIFPEGSLIGTVKEEKLDKHQNFHDIEVKLAVDFEAVDYVYVVDFKDRNEILKLQTARK